MQAPSVTLCIINYNGAGYLVEAFAAALAHPQRFAQVLLIDNASTDDSVAQVAARFPEVRILTRERNEGPGAARNTGFAAASCDLILFQDNDVRLQPGVMTLLLETLATHPQALLVAPRVLYAQDPKLIQYDSADCHVLGLMAPRNADRRVGHRGLIAGGRTSSVVTACFLLDRRRWQHGALFDEDFGFNLEDHDFGVRANLLGYETLVEPRATVLHGGGTAALSYRPGYEVAAARIFYLIRNRWLVIVKNFALRTILVLAPLLVLFEVLQIVGLARKGWLRQWGRALGSLVYQWPQLRHKRAAVQRSRRVADREILRNGPLPFTQAVSSGRVASLALSLMARIVNVYWHLARRLL